MLLADTDPRFASVSGLGRFRKLYVPSRGEAIFRVLVVSLIVATLVWQATSRVSASAFIWIALAASAVVLLFLAWAFWHQQGDAVALYDGGIACLHRESLVQVQWDEISQLRETVSMPLLIPPEEPPVSQQWLDTRDGRKVELPEMQDREGLWTAIGEEVARRLLPDRLAAMKAGQVLAFGPYRVDRNGLRFTQAREERCIEWAKIRAVGNEPALPLGKLAVWIEAENPAYTDRWAGVPRYLIPDAAIFLALCRHFARLDQAGTPKGGG